jgi:PTS system nitrogen regulatory IIA component
MKVHHLLTEDLVITDLVSAGRDSVLEEMARHVKTRGRIAGEKDLYGKLVQRENLGSTSVGHGLAIPHCRMQEAADPVVALAVSKRGVAFESVDGRPVHVFFLVVTAPENPSVNLEILGAISHLIRQSRSLPKRIMAAGDPRRVIEIIWEEEKKLDE